MILIVDRRFQRNLKSVSGQEFYYPGTKHNYYLKKVWEYRFMGKVCHHTSQLSIDLSERIYSIQENFDLKKILFFCAKMISTLILTNKIYNKKIYNLSNGKIQYRRYICSCVHSSLRIPDQTSELNGPAAPAFFHTSTFQKGSP